MFAVLTVFMSVSLKMGWRNSQVKYIAAHLPLVEEEEEEEEGENCDNNDQQLPQQPGPENDREELPWERARMEEEREEPPWERARMEEEREEPPWERERMEEEREAGGEGRQ